MLALIAILGGGLIAGISTARRAYHQRLLQTRAAQQEAAVRAQLTHLGAQIEDAGPESRQLHLIFRGPAIGDRIFEKLDRVDKCERIRRILFVQTQVNRSAAEAFVERHPHVVISFDPDVE